MGMHGWGWISTTRADAYILQNWAYFQSNQSPSPKYSFDGGVPVFDSSPTHKTTRDKSKKVFMYMGALTEHGALLNLVKSFHAIDNNKAELWITGRGENAELEAIVKEDSRIKLFGLLPEEELHHKALAADFFVNPRVVSFAPNKLNFLQRSSIILLTINLSSQHLPMEWLTITVICSFSQMAVNIASHRH